MGEWIYMKQTTTLQNGLVVITEKIEHASSAMLSYWVKAGGDYEKGYPFGVAHFLEHMMFKGTKKRNKYEISEDASFIGAIQNAGTYTDKTTYYLQIPYHQWKPAVELLSDMMFHSTFPEDEMEMEKKVVLEEIKSYSDDPASLAFGTLQKEIMAHYPEKQEILGTAESVMSITRNDIVRFVNEFYQPKNMIFVATGNVDHEEIVAYLEELLPKEVSGERKEMPAFEEHDFAGKEVTITKEIDQSHVCWALFGPNVFEKENSTMRVLAQILGGGMSSRLFKKIREDRGLAYSASAMYGADHQTGLLRGYVGTSKEHVEEVKRIILEELDLLQHEFVSDIELQRAKNSLTGRKMIADDRTDAKYVTLAVKELYNVFLETETFKKEIEAVTKEDIQKVAQKYLQKKPLFVQVLPKN